MIKMYNAEVLSKFPVVQHFPFGSLFSWERDPNATNTAPSVHTNAQPLSMTNISATRPSQATKSGMAPTAAPWAKSSSNQTTTQDNMVPTRAPWAKPSSNQSSVPGATAPTRAPWANSTPGATPGNPAPSDGRTRAPWAKG